MAHHAYFISGSIEAGVSTARTYADHELGLSGRDNPDLSVLSFGLFSVEDARKLIGAAYQSGTAGKKVIIASMTRLFHEAQNALLKVLEEPPEGVTIILIVPSEGMFLPTLRSRLLPLPIASGEEQKDAGLAAELLAATPAEREKMISKLLDRTKSDKEDQKQLARNEALQLLQGLTRTTHTAFIQHKASPEKDELRLFLEDLSAFVPLLYERSGPLKLIFEHILLVIPKSLNSGKV